LVGSIARAAIEGLIPLGRNADAALEIKEYLEVVGSDGEHVGTVDHTESADQIVLTDDDPKAGRKPHLISVKWVDYSLQQATLRPASTRTHSLACAPHLVMNSPVTSATGLRPYQSAISACFIVWREK
jgi:hypothetical protein